MLLPARKDLIVSLEDPTPLSRVICEFVPFRCETEPSLCVALVVRLRS
jgi:hypothetical protein